MMKKMWMLLLVFITACNTATAATSTLPKNLKVIEEEAFAGTALTEVELPDGLETLESKAFLPGSLSFLYRPLSLVNIADDAYDKANVNIRMNSRGLKGWIYTFEFVETIDPGSSGAIRTQEMDGQARAWAMAMANGDMVYGHTGLQRMESIVAGDSAESIGQILKNHSDVSKGTDKYGFGVVRITLRSNYGVDYIDYIGAGIGDIEDSGEQIYEKPEGYD